MMNELRHESLLLKVTEQSDPPILSVLWEGKSSSRDPSLVLKPFFDKLLVRTQKAGAALEMHFEKLEHFNSSTIASLIQLINGATEQRIALRFFYDGHARWQALSFDAIQRALAPFGASAPATVHFVAVT
jgi:hypothetical protein